MIRYEAICEDCNRVLVASDGVEITAANVDCPVDPKHTIIMRAWTLPEDRTFHA